MTVSADAHPLTWYPPLVWTKADQRLRERTTHSAPVITLSALRSADTVDHRGLALEVDAPDEAAALVTAVFGPVTQ